jgi:hypothetical protein
MTTNTDKIIETLRRWPSLDDDALERRADVHPRQQVNQICRRLEQQGVLKRIKGRNGKIANVLVRSQTRPAAAPSVRSGRLARRSLLAFPRLFLRMVHQLVGRSGDLVPSASRKPPELPSQLPADHEHSVAADLSSTLFIIPCSSKKEAQSGTRMNGPSLLDELSPALARRLKDAREGMLARAKIDEATLLPAWRRYSGALYKAAAPTIAEVQDRGLNMLIISGGYGLVLASEPIGNYNARFNLSFWPRDLLEDVMLEYVRRRGLKNVRAITSLTGDYRKLLTRVRWASVGVHDATLLSPRARGGAMVLSPRAQGEALAALLRGTIDESWSSSDGLRMDVHRMP